MNEYLAVEETPRTHTTWVRGDFAFPVASREG